MGFYRYPRRWARALGWSVAMSLSTSVALACSTVALGSPDRPLVAYSFDFDATGAGFIFVNPAGVMRSSIMEGTPAQWAARHGSVTFNQLGPGMPAAGMNTAGLVVSLMWNNGAVYGGEETAPIVNELEFIQRLLDTSGSVDEALAQLEGIRIEGIVPIHYFLADRTGMTAALTPTASGFLVHTGDDMPLAALTNTSYAELLEEVTAFDGFGGTNAVPRDADREADPNSLQRFAVAASASRMAGSLSTADQAFGVLDDLANLETRWQIVFDQAGQQIDFRIVGQDGTYRIALPEIDWRCRDRPLAAQLPDVSGKAFPEAFAPANPAAVSAVSREVLSSFSKASGLGPEIADGLTAGQLASAVCPS